ncbi:MAG: hypothetical protein V5A68_04900 [Candidatus Thermoplasmatota archaeon]
MKKYMNNTIKIFLTLMTIFILIVSSIPTVITEKQKYSNNKTEVLIKEYRSDGTIAEKQKFIDIDKLEKIYREIKKEENFTNQLNVLKKYRVINKEISFDSVENNFTEKKSFLSTKQIEVLQSTFRLPLIISGLNKINAVFLTGTSLVLGTSGLTFLYNLLSHGALKGFDALDIAWGGLGRLKIEDLLFKHRFVAFPCFLLMAGFIGLSVHVPGFFHIFSGYSTATLSFGIGIHTTF